MVITSVVLLFNRFAHSVRQNQVTRLDETKEEDEEEEEEAEEGGGGGE